MPKYYEWVSDVIEIANPATSAVLDFSAMKLPANMVPDAFTYWPVAGCTAPAILSFAPDAVDPNKKATVTAVFPPGPVTAVRVKIMVTFIHSILGKHHPNGAYPAPPT